MVDNLTILSDTPGKNFFISFTIFFKKFHCLNFEIRQNFQTTQDCGLSCSVYNLSVTAYGCKSIFISVKQI